MGGGGGLFITAIDRSIGHHFENFPFAQIGVTSAF